MRGRAVVFAAFAATLAAAGCAGTGGHDAASTGEAATIVVRGAFTYGEPIALPPHARLIVECREGTSADGPLVVTASSSLDGKQVPFPFELLVPRSRLVSGRFYGVRGAVFVDGLPQWLSYPEAVETGADSMDLSSWVLRPALEGEFRSVLACGEDRVGIRYSRSAMLLATAGETIEMRPVPAASGVRYQAVGDSTTTFWNKGDRAIVTIHGRQLPDCFAGSPDVAPR